MRKRYQKGSLQLRKQGGVWVWLGQWRDGENGRTKTLGRKSEMTKTEARGVLDGILAPLNAKHDLQSGTILLGDFVRGVYLPFCRRKWKRSTRMTTEQRIGQHVVAELEGKELRLVRRDGLQDLLDRKAAAGLSFSVVGHIRWDLRHIFRLAVAEGFIERNPAEMLFTPQNAKRTVKRVATAEEMARAFAAMNLRERLMLKLAGIAGMRPGEVFGLKWRNLEPPYVEVRQRVYQGVVDTPKSPKSFRRAALSASLLSDVAEWRTFCLDTSPEAWVFASETGKTPLRPDNVGHHHIRPKLEKLGLEWITFQVLRRSCSSLMSDQGVDAKVVADQLGHTLDVNQNVYTRVGFDRMADAVNRLDSALLVN